MRRRFVVDASVAAQWYLPEEHSAAAELLLERELELLAPDLLYVEVAAIAWQHVRRGEIDDATAERILAELRQVPFTSRPVSELAPEALALSLRTGRTVYECLYLTLAIQGSCQMVTADRLLHDALAAGPLAGHVLWIGNLA